MDQILGRVEALALDGKFGPGKFVKVTECDDGSAAPQFASQLQFLVVELEVDSTSVRVPIVVKIQPLTAAERELQNSNYQFRAEVSAYSEIIPTFGSDVAPKFYYGEGTFGADPETDIVILQDLRGLGFKTATNIFLSPREVEIALRLLGEFHGSSYRMKRTQKSHFDELKKDVPLKPVMSTESESFVFACVERGFNAAKLQVKSPKSIDEALAILKKYGTINVRTKMCLPEEPFSVILHGDFNRNNLMYKYSADGEAEAVKFVDFQNSHYGDPAIDISFFLYMNTTQETRDEHWDGFMKVYWEGLTAVEPTPDFSYQDFINHFRTRAMYGYLICSFFLPLMLDPVIIPLPEFMELDEETKIQRMITSGGEQGTNVIAAIVEDLLSRGYLDGFMDWAERHLC